MESETNSQPAAGSAWEAKQVYAMAVISLVVGLAIGYLFRGSQSLAPPAQPAAAAAPPAAAPGGMGATAQKMPTLDEMKVMADKKAEPLLEKLKADPKNSDTLIQIAKIYRETHQFKQAAAYYGKALELDPKNVPVRTEMASCMYYDGDADGAIDQLQRALQYSPKDANSLFNLGMIKWHGKQDNKGAVEAWQRLLKSNPELSPDRVAQVQRLMADARLQNKN